MHTCHTNAHDAPASQNGISRRSAVLGATGIGVASPALAGIAAGCATPLVAGMGIAPKIDIYDHVIPSSYLELVRQRYRDTGMVGRLTSIRMLWDIDARAEMLDQWPEVQQVLTLANPPPEALGGPEESPQAARVANDAMAEIVRPISAKVSRVRRRAADEQRAPSAARDGSGDR